MKVLIKQRKSRFYPWLIFFLLVSILFPIGSIFSIFYEYKEPQITNVEAHSIEVVASELMDDMLDNVTENNGLVFEITEEQVNSVIVSAIENAYELLPKEVKNALKSCLKGYYFTIEDDQYVFNVIANVYGFATLIELRCKLDWVSDIPTINQRELIFEIIDLKIGKISYRDNISGIPEILLSEETLNDYISQLGLKLNVDLNNLRVTYKISDLINDVFTLANVQMEGLDLIGIFNTFANHDILDISFYEDKKISVVLDLEPFIDNPRICTHDKDNDKIMEDIPEYIDFVEELNKLGEVSQDDLSIVIRYLIRGYEGLRNVDKAIIDEYAELIPLVEIEGLDKINDITTYVPHSGILKEGENANLIDDIFGNIDDTELLNGNIADITETDINNILESTYILGYNFLFPVTVHHDDGTSKTKYHFAIIDNLYCNIVEGHFYVTIGINLNGFEMTLSFIFHINEDNTEPYTISFFAENSYFGEVKLTDDLNTFLYPILKDSFNEAGIAEFNPENGQLVFSFKEYVGDINDKLHSLGMPGEFDDYAEIIIKLRGLLNEEGHMNLTWKLK